MVKGLTDADIELLRQMANEYRLRRQRPDPDADRVHRASDIVRVRVTSTIPARSPSHDPNVSNAPTHDVWVWDVLRDVQGEYQIPITEQPEVIIVPGFYYAAIDRDGIWLIVHPEFALYRFVLLSNLVGSGICNIRDMDGTTIATNMTILDPEFVFDELETDDRGYCIYQNRKFYAIQAPCPDEVP